MVIVNGRIAMATRSELMQYWLSRRWSDLVRYADYERECIRTGTKIMDENVLEMNSNERMLNTARRIVVDYFNSHVDATDGVLITCDNVYIVWFSKTLQNWKAMVSTDVMDGMYYEITHNGDKNETYVDVYKKWQNFTVRSA